MRTIAVDWSGRSTGEAEYIWLAEVSDRELTSLENGRTRKELIQHIIDQAEGDPEIVVGFDFAFSFPKWWCDTRGWRNVRGVWRATGIEAEHLLAACEPPFWGRPGKRSMLPRERRFRRTEREDTKTAKAVFQIGGRGAVGTGSLRGMPYLHTLAEQGFSVWPFDTLRPPGVIEIYPRVLTGPITKNHWLDRHEFLRTRFSAQPATMLELAAGSEDAFDAAVSALVMAEHQDALAELQATSDPEFSVEGRIWRPDS